MLLFTSFQASRSGDANVPTLWLQKQAKTWGTISVASLPIITLHLLLFLGSPVYTQEIP